MVEFTESKIRYLELIQNNIARMNQNSLQTKTFMLTTVTAITAFISTDDVELTHYKKLVGLVCFVIILFLILDAYYLWMEKKFRSLYNDVIEKDECKDLFKMDISNYNRGIKNFVKSSVSWSLLIYPLMFFVYLFIFVCKGGKL